MALKRNFLQALGIEDDKIDEIIEAHSETVNGLKDERDQAREKAKEADTLKAELEDAKKTIKANETGENEYKEKYEKLQSDFDQFKADIEKAEISRKKDRAYRELLKTAGVSEKRHDGILKLTDLEGVELDGDNLKDADNLIDGIKTEWADFIITEKSKGAYTETPPANNGVGATMTKSEIRAIKDPSARQKAMVENGALFGLD